MADLALRPLSLGELLDRAFTVYRQRFGALLISTIACMVVPILMVANNLRFFGEFAQASQGGTSREEAMEQAYTLMGKMFWVGLVALIGFVIARTALAWISHKALLGERADAFEGLEKGVRFLPQMLGLAIVEGAIYMVAMGVMYIPAIFLVMGNLRGGGAGAVFGLLAWMAALIAVMFYLVCAFFVTSSVLVAEADSTVFRTFERSWTLTKDRRLTIFGGILVVGVLAFVLQLGLAIGARVMVGNDPDQTGPFMLVVFGLNVLVNLLTTGYYYVFQMVMYYDLRIRKEGLDLELASEAMAPA
ncbi:MAG: hypothetical protein ABJB33_04820 [Gemmatimonadota bacterium]